METVKDRLNRAQATGNRAEIRAALTAAKEAGAGSEVDQALAELDRLDATSGGTDTSAGSGSAAAEASNGAAPPAQSADEAAERKARADGLKKRGNECLKNNTKSAAREAMEFFTAGLEVHCEDRVLNAQFFSNRAHVRILLKQFVEAVDDCRKAIDIDPKNMKAYWRAAKASLNLDLCRNAIEFCEAGLRQEPNDADIMKLKVACAEKLSGQQQRRAELANRARSDINADEAMAVQNNVNELNEQCSMMKGALVQKQREQHKGELTKKTLAEIPADTNMYIGVGRTFVLEPREAIEKKLNAKLESLVEEIPRLEKTHAEMERRKDAAEKEWTEICEAHCNVLKEQQQRSGQ